MLCVLKSVCTLNIFISNNDENVKNTKTNVSSFIFLEYKKRSFFFRATVTLTSSKCRAILNGVHRRDFVKNVRNIVDFHLNKSLPWSLWNMKLNDADAHAKFKFRGVFVAKIKFPFLRQLNLTEKLWW